MSELLVKISGDSSSLQKELAASQRQMKRAFGSDALGASKALVGGIGLVSAALGGIGVASVKMAADMEQNKIAFTTMLGSAEKAKSFLDSLATFAEKTPLEFTGLVQSSKKLLAYGYTAQEIIPMMTNIGDAVAAMGGSADVLDRVTLAFGQMKAKGFVSGEEMRQLAEAGIPAWQMLANVIGKDIPTTMKLAEDKALNANAAIAGMLEQMGTKYGGMMEKQSNTITGILSNLKDKGGNIMRQLGDEIVEALDLKTKLQGALKFLGDFAANVKSSGIKEAIAQLIPPELELAIFAVAGAITAALIPSLYGLAAAAVAAMIPLWPLLAIGAALGAAFYVVKEAQKQLKDSSDALIASVDAECEGLSQEEAAALRAATGYNELAAAKRNAANVSAWEKNYTDHRRPGDGSFLDTEPPDASTVITGGGGGGKSGPDPVKEAERVSESIEREWAQTTKTELEQLDLWRAQQIEALDKTAEANENYERDKERVAATYSVRRQKILEQEAEKAREIGKTIRDAWQGIVYNSNGLTGNQKDMTDLAKSHQDAINSIGDKWDQLAEKYKTSTQAEKDVFLQNLKARGVAYQDLGNGEISFEQNKLAELKKLNEQYYLDLQNRHATCRDIQSEIDAAYNANSMTALQAALTEENALRLNNYTAQQSMMQTYQEAFLAAHSTTAQLMANLYKGAFDSMSSSISDLITGAKSVSEAFSAMGQAMLKVIADYVAKWIAGKVMMAIFGKSTMAAETAAGVAAGSAMAAAWAPAAAAVSLATFGANSAPAMAGMSAAYGLSIGFSAIGEGPGSFIGALANGGLTTGPSLNLIGEGKYQEAVLPLSDRVFGKIAKGIDNQSAGQGGGGNSLTIHVSTPDAKSFRQWLNDVGGEEIQRYFNGQAAGFAGV